LPLTSFNKKKQKKGGGKYSIVTFDLEKPKGNKYPTFDFAKVKRKLGEGSSDEEDERFHDKDALELVRRMEEKYGKKKTKSGRRMRFNEDDFIEKSLGYDVEDAFIDDTEAHDELVPSTLDTKKGGFYVNKGKLDFVPIDEEFSDDESDEDEERPKKAKKKQEETIKEAPKPVAKVPKPKEKEKVEDVKKTLENKPKKRVAVSSSSESDEDNEGGERRLVGGPPTLKRSKTSGPVVPPKNGKEKVEEKKKELEKTDGEKRRMAGAPPSMLKKKVIPPSDVPSRPSIPLKPPTAVPLTASPSVAVPSTQRVEPNPADVQSSEDEVQVVDEAAASQESSSTTVELNMSEVPKQVQQQVVQYSQLCLLHVKPGKKHVSQILVDKAIEIQDLTNRLAMKKSMRGLVVDRLAEMCGYTRAGLVSRMNSSVKTTPSTSSTALPPPVQQGGGGMPSPARSTTTTDEGPPVLAPAVVKQKTAPAALPVPPSVIGFKPPTVATAAPAVVKTSSVMVNKWTQEQVQKVLAEHPQLNSSLIGITRKYTYEEFTTACKNAVTSNASSSVSSPAPSSKSTTSSVPAASTSGMGQNYEDMKKNILDHLSPAYKENLRVILTHKDIKAHMDKALGTLKLKYKLAEKSSIFMDFSDQDLVHGFEAYVTFAVKIFEKRPLHLLAFLDTIMSTFCQEYGRTDRLVRHFTSRFNQLEAVKRLPEYYTIGKLMNQKEKEVTQKMTDKALKVEVKANSQPIPVAAKPVQRTLPSTSAAQQQQENGNAVLLAQMKKMQGMQVTKSKVTKDVVTID
ncbi:hypothetical protein PFISCL1PPCAC_10233, partial [Pristionchus fissidentatus]